MTHIYHSPSTGKDTERAICYYFLRSEDRPLDDDGKVCPDCAEMAETILRTHIKRPATKR